MRDVRREVVEKKLIKLLNSEKDEDAIQYIINLMIKYNSDEKEFKKLGELFYYFVANREGIVLYHLRKQINMPQAPEGLQYRHLGTMEHNTCDVLAQMMRGRKMSWSISGTDNLAKILAEKASKRIYNIINEVCYGLISEDKLETITDIITLIAADTNNKVKKNKYYPVQQSSIAFTGYSMTNGRKAIQSFFNKEILVNLFIDNLKILYKKLME